MENLKYSEILRLNKEIGIRIAEMSSYNIAVLSNIITSQLNEVLEYSLRKQNINANVTSGDYDNLIHNSSAFAGSDLVIIFFETSNLIDGFQYKANLMDEKAVAVFISKVKTEIDFLLDNLKNTALVIFNKFSSSVFNPYFAKTNNYENICNELNEYLVQRGGVNTILFDLDRIFAKKSVEKCVDFRYYYSSKALYTIEFYKTYSQFINPIIRSVKGHAKKALIFDCDNTLWKGVLGEDGFDNIEMSGKTKGGVVYEEVQSLALELCKHGILIGLCSKNNPGDIEHVINNHPDMILRNENITIKKVNWDDKLSNLKAIAKELNIGLNSIVFVDDSDFEVGLIKEQLKEVTVLQVPSNRFEYPALIRESLNLFYSISETEEDLSRIEMYKNQMQREKERKSFNTIDSYLASLELSIKIHLDNINIVPRIAQMTQKTNQFNLTTKRYTETEIENFIKSDEFRVLAFEVSDKYGDSGITAIAILKINHASKKVIIDTFLMSCRVIGRNLELTIMDIIVDYISKIGLMLVEAFYSKSSKNEQVSEFYSKIGFTIIDNNENEKKYLLKLSEYNPQNLNYIKIDDGREN